MLMNVLVPSEGDTAIRIPPDDGRIEFLPREGVGALARPWVYSVTDLGVESRLLVPVRFLMCLGPGSRPDS